VQCPGRREVEGPGRAAPDPGRVAAWLRTLWRAETGLFLGIWAALMVSGRSRMFNDPGTFWHTALGRKMLSSGRLVEADPFSFTFGGSPWVPQSWLAECFMAAVHGESGRDGLLLATVTILAALYSWGGHRLLRSGLHWLPTTLIVALAISASTMHFLVRPHIATIALLGLTFGLLSNFEAGRLRLGGLIWLVPVFIVWTNLHGGVLAGLATLGLTAIGWGCYRLVGWDSPVRRSGTAVMLGILVLTCGLTTVVNPYGLRLPRTWLLIAGSPVLPRLIVEHAPPSSRDVEFWMILLSGLAYAGALAGIWPRRPRASWLVPLVWFALALSRVRNAPLFAITGLVALADFLPYTSLAAWLARPGRDLFLASGPAPDARTRRLGWMPAALPLAILLSVVALQLTGLRVPVLGRGWAHLDPEAWPVDLLPDLRRVEREHPEGSRIFNDFGLGGFLIDQTPGLEVFIDDRCELYGDAWLSQYWDAQTRDPAQIDEWCKSYHVPYALVRNGSSFDRYLANNERWLVIGRCRAAALYRRIIDSSQMITSMEGRFDRSKGRTQDLRRTWSSLQEDRGAGSITQGEP
jgi:hypothetical protein